MTFIHLRARTSYSLLESALSISRIAKLAVADMMPAVGITDTDNLYGALEASDKLAAAGVQPIIGTTITIADFGRVALLARNETGYANLCRLSSEAHLRPADGKSPSVAMQVAASHADGLLCLSGGPDGAIGTAASAGNMDLAEKRLRWLASTYGNGLYVEMQRSRPDWRDTEPALLSMAYANRLPLVATHECLFATPDDYEAHDTLLAIAEGKRIFEDDRRRVSREQWWQPQIEMKRLFADLPEAIRNTVEIARRCAYRPRGRKPLLPHFSADEQAELLQQAREGLALRLQVGVADGYTVADYEARLEYEAGIISQMGFSGYFLIVADFIKWAKANGIPVGPGRGSGAGSVVAWALTITDLDPLRWGLLFERFLNPERVSMPDFDVDFCQERREEVIRYVQQRYGSDHVAQIVTHGRLQARAVLRDVGRAMSLPYGQINRVCGLVPNNPAHPVTIAEALEIEPRLAEERDRDETSQIWLSRSMRLEGLYRHASTHAAGVVIGDRPLCELVPLCVDPKTGGQVTQFNWKVAEQAGLVKFDFLGLKTLTVIRKTLEQIKAGRGIALRIGSIPLDDSPTFELLCAADTVGVFQLESGGMRGALKSLKPDRFEDIIAMVALYRPGPMENIPLYVARKHGKEGVEYPHEMIAPILEETYGVIVYQEQVIQIAQVLAGFSAGQADILRRAMGKKDPVEMARQRDGFVAGAIRNGVDGNHAGEIFDLVDRFAGYGFNKSHAAAYALLAYQTAFLKANYREEFLAASMTLEMADTEKLALFSLEARKGGIVMASPDVNAGSAEFVAEPAEQARIRYALSGLKHVGTAAAAAIAGERARGGPYKSLGEFARRMPPKVLTKRTVEMLAGAGALDGLEPNRAAIHDGAMAVVAYAKQEAEDYRKGVLDLFGDNGSGARVLALPDAEWSVADRCNAEHAAIGSYVSGHPLDGYKAELAKLGVLPRSEVDKRAAKMAITVPMAGVVVGPMKRKFTKNGDPMAFLSLSDRRGQFECIVFSDALEMIKEKIVQGAVLIFTVTVKPRGDSMSYAVEAAQTIEEAAISTQKAKRARG